MAPRLRALALWLGVAAVGSLLPARAGAQELERGIYEITVAGTQQRTTTRVLLDGGRVLLPLHEVLLQTGIPGERSGNTWRFEWPPPDYSTRLEPETGRFWRGERAGALPPGSWRLDDGVLHVDSAAIHLLFDALLRADPTQLVAALSHAEGFPVQRLLLEEQRRRVRLRDPLRRGPAPHVTYPATTGGLALNWDASALVREERTSGVLRAVAGASVLGGALEAGGSAGVNVELGSADRIARFVRPFPDNPWIQQLTLGTVVSPTPVPRFLDGAYISNAPFVQPTDFQEVAYRPTLPPGWTAEVYEGETLLGVVNAQDLESVDLPVGYGFTPVRVRMVGPAGQERTEQLQYIVPTSRLPARRIEYNLGFGSCRNSPCDQYGFADLSRGFNPWLTMGAGASYLRAGDTTRLRPYATLSLNPRPNLALDAHTEGTAHARAALQYLGSRNQSVSATLAWFDPDDPTLSLAGTYATLTTSLYLLQQYFTTSGQLHLDTRGRIADGQLFTGVPLGRGYVGTQWYRSRTSPDLLGLRGFWRTNPLPPLGGPLNLGASTAFSRDGLDLVELTASIQPQRTASLNAALQWRPGTGTTALNLTYTLRTGVGLAQARSVVAGSEPHLVVGMSGGVAADHHAATASYTGAVGRAGIDGTVFLDDNGNGRRDPGEAAVADVPVLAEGQRAVSDARGRFHLWDLQPVRATRFFVDSLGVPDLRIAPARAEYVLRLPANTFTRLDIPLIRTREVSGRLTYEGRSTGGIAVELRSDDGAVLLQTRTFSDGEFYFPRVAPGRYRVAVAEASLAALQAFAEPFTIELRSAGPDAVRLPDMVLLPEAAQRPESRQATGNRTPPARAAAPLQSAPRHVAPRFLRVSGNRTSHGPRQILSTDCRTYSSVEECRRNASRPATAPSARAGTPRTGQPGAGAFDAWRPLSSWYGLAVLDRVLTRAALRAAGAGHGERLGYDRCISIDAIRFECNPGQRETARGRGVGGPDEPRRIAREFAHPSRRGTRVIGSRRALGYLL